MEAGRTGGVYALSETVDHMLSLQDFFGPFQGMNPGVSRVEDCESLFTHLKTKKAAAERYLVQNFPSIQQALGDGELGNAYWLPGAQNPAYGLTQARGGVVPLVGLLESGCFNPGYLRPLRGAAWEE